MDQSRNHTPRAVGDLHRAVTVLNRALSLDPETHLALGDRDAVAKALAPLAGDPEAERLLRLG